MVWSTCLSCSLAAVTGLADFVYSLNPGLSPLLHLCRCPAKLPRHRTWRDRPFHGLVAGVAGIGRLEPRRHGLLGGLKTIKSGQVFG